VGERSLVPNWSERQNYLQYFLVGTKPIGRGVTDIVHKYDALVAAGKLGVGNVDEQWREYQKLLAKSVEKKETQRGSLG